MSTARGQARAVLLSAAGLALGCSASELGPFVDLYGAGTADAAASPETSSSPEASSLPEASDDAQGADLPAPLTWTAVNANLLEGDIVSIWGTGTTDVYVGTDMESVYLLTNGVSIWTGVSTQVVGGGWGSDARTVYAVGASAWLTQMGLASGGGLFHYTGDGAWTSVASGAFYVYAATSSALGTILHSAGDGNWQTSYAEAGSEAWAVWSGEPGDAYAIVVPSGMANPPAHLVHSTKGGGWVTESVGPTPTTLVALWGSGPNDVYAGGSSRSEAVVDETTPPQGLDRSRRGRSPGISATRLQSDSLLYGQ